MVIHEESYTISNLWWILYKTFRNEKPIGNYKKEWYFNIPCAFDIETTSFIDSNGDKCACMYIWMLGINGYVVIGRTWDELMIAINIISKFLELGDGLYLPIYVHNLSYEFQFIKDRFEWEKIFSLDSRKPNYARTKSGIEFRCSYQLSGTNLATVGKNLQKYKVAKMVGDLDYSKIRNSKTELSKDELKYCIHDVLVVMAYIQECIDIEGDITQIPMTKTGYVRRYVKKKCLGTSKHRNVRYRKFIKNLTLGVDEYKLLRRAFQGGFTHASSFYSGQILHDVDSYDFTSSYPTVMLCELFPMSKGEYVTINSMDDFYNNLNMYCCLFDVKFTNIRAKVLYEDYLSKSHCYNIVNSEVNNGRIVNADSLITTITDIDFKIISAMYEWDNIQIGTFIRYKKQYLPKEFIDAILTLYEDKTKLKDVKGKETEYMLAKANLNSLYGMIVTDICRDEVLYEDSEWNVLTADIETCIKKYNNSRARFLFYPWGVWVTAYARLNLFTGIISCGEDYIYSDTDSIKILHGDKHLDYIEKYNDMVNQKISNAMTYIGYPIERTRPKTIKGIEKPIGIWDYEGHYNSFKTLGAKRYIWQNDNGYQMTIAGLNKKTGLEYLLSLESDDVTVFDLFTNDMYIPKGHTGKMIHTYIDEPRKGYIEDYQGNIAEYDEVSCLYMEDADYTLSIGREYANYLMGIREMRG